MLPLVDKAPQDTYRTAYIIAVLAFGLGALGKLTSQPLVLCCYAARRLFAATFHLYIHLSVHVPRSESKSCNQVKQITDLGVIIEGTNEYRVHVDTINFQPFAYNF